MVENSLEAAATNGTERSIVAHHAVHGGTEEALRLVGGTLVDPQGTAASGNRDRWSGNRSGRRQHVGPFGLEIDQRGDIGLGGFDDGTMDVGKREVGGDILVGKAAHAVAQLVRQNAGEHIVESGNSIEIVDSAATIGMSIVHDDDEVARGRADDVVETEEVERHKIAVDAEDATVGTGRTANAKDIEVVAAGEEGFAGEDGVGKTTHIEAHLRSLVGPIAVGNNDNIHLGRRVAPIEKGVARRGWGRRQGTRVVGIEMPESTRSERIVGQTVGENDEDLGAGTREKEYLVERDDAVACKSGGTIFIEKRPVVVGKKQTSGVVVAHLDPVGAVVERIDQSGTRACP